MYASFSSYNVTASVSHLKGERTLELLQLKYFQEVAKYEHFTRASKNLHIAQSTLSISISHLEEELRIQLFDRTGKHIKLNRYGKAFLERVDKAFLQLEVGRKELQDMAENQEKVFTFAANNLYSYSTVLDQYNKLHPNLHYRQIVGSTRKMRQSLLNGEIDFCISSPSIVGDGIECIPLATEEMYLFVSKQHKFNSRTSIALSEAKDEPFISLPPEFGIRDLLESLCQQAGFKPNIAFESLLSTGILDLVNINMGITLLPIPEWVQPPESMTTPIHISTPLCFRTVSLSYMKDKYLPATTKAFIDYIVSYFKTINNASASKTKNID